MLKIYTDGGSHGNPGPGGYGVVILNKDTMIEYFYKDYPDVTNNQMELSALLRAIEYAHNNQEKEFVIYSDSAYCVNMCNDWIWKWSMNGWQTSKKEEIKNIQLVKKIWQYVSGEFPNFRVEKCPGHAGIIGNELADALANNDLVKFKKIKEENGIKYRFDFFI